MQISNLTSFQLWPASISKVLFCREEADRKSLVPKYLKKNHNFVILSCFPNIVRLKSLEALSVRLLSFPFFLIFKVFVQCPKQIFKLSSSKTGVKTDGGGWEGEIQYSRSDWFVPRLSSLDTNPGKKGPGVLPPAV